jgi:hypothetical protein
MKARGGWRGVACMLCLCSFLVLAGYSSAEDNPVDGYVMVRWIHEGEPNWGYVCFSAARWHPDNTGWCDHYTSDGNKYHHGHWGSGLPFMAGQVEVTAAKVKAFWDATYFKDYTYVSEATCAVNCHGYCTGKGFVVGADAAGILQVLADDYKEWDEPVTYSVKADSSHSVRITDVYQGCEIPNTVKTIREKINSSPVYTRTYEPPGEVWMEDIYVTEDW